MTAGLPVASSALPATRVLAATEVAELLGRLAVGPASPATLDHDTALAVLRQLHELQRRRGKEPLYVSCPYCRNGFDIAHSRPCTGPPKQPPRHPDPIGAADCAPAAEAAALALAKAALWGKDGLDGYEVYWVDLGRGVLWPLLFLARNLGRGMDGVRLQTHPAQMPLTLLSVGTALAELPSGTDAGAAQRQWALVAAFDARTRRGAFGAAFHLVHRWQYTATLV